MTPPADDTSKKLDGPSAVPSLGEQATGPDAGGSESSPVPSLGEQSTAGDQGSSIVDLGDLAGGIDDFGEIVELEVRYEIQDTLGSGGMGLVQRAIDRRLQRSVAIKRLKDELAKSRSAARRFLAEAQAVATLNHFNIVQVYDYGYATDGPFIVMELVEGQSLKERLAGGPLELETAVEIAGQLCDALTLAHGWGIVHRDIKPGNILLTPDGVPKLSDFGLARQAKIDEGQTRTGAVLGTLDFMSPEQKADATSVDARSDLWSLAATLYQMVTGELPRVIRGDRVDPVLAPVLLKALEEDPERRHESAEEFGEELRQVVIARAESMSASRYEIAEGTCAHCGAENELSRKFCRGCGKTLQDPCLNCRTPLAVWERFCGDCGTDALEALQQQLGTVETQRQEIASQRRSYRYQEAIEGLESLVSLDHSRLSEQSTWAGKALSVIREEYTEWGQRRESLVGAAEEQLAEGNDRAARGYLDEIPEPLHTEAVKALYERLTSRREEAKSLAKSIRAAVADRDDTTTRPLLERFLKLRPGDKQAQSLYEQLQDRETETVFGSGEALQQNGPELVQVDSGSILDSRRFGRKLRRRQKRWPDWTRNRRLTGMIGAGFLVVIGLLVFMWPETPDSAADRDVAGTKGLQDQPVAGKDNTQPQQVENRLVARLALTLEGHTDIVRSVAFSNDGKRIASGSDDNTVKVWDAITGRMSLVFHGHTDQVRSVAFSPDGKWIVSCGKDRTLKVWDSKTGEEIHTLRGHTTLVWGVSVSPDGQKVVSSGEDSVVIIWDAETGQKDRTLNGHFDQVWTVDFSPDGKRIVSGGFDETVKLWDAKTGGEMLTLSGHSSWVSCVDFRVDGKRVVSSSWDGTVKVWDVETGQETLTLKGHSGSVFGVSFSPDGKHIVSGSDDKTVKIWDPQTGKEMLTVKGHM